MEKDLEIIAYVVVRRSDGPEGAREWIDPTVLADTPAWVRRLADERDTRTPKWASLNPVVRTLKVRVTPMEET